VTRARRSSSSLTRPQPIPQQPQTTDNIPAHLADHPISVAWSAPDGSTLVTEPVLATAADSSSSAAALGRERMRHSDTVAFRRRGGDLLTALPREHTLKAQSVKGGRRTTLAKAKVDLSVEICGGGGGGGGEEAAAPPLLGSVVEREVVFWLPVTSRGSGGGAGKHLSLRAVLRAECASVKGPATGSAAPPQPAVLPPLTPSASSVRAAAPPGPFSPSSSGGGSGSGSAGSSPRYSWAAAARAPDPLPRQQQQEQQQQQQQPPPQHHHRRRPLSCPSADAGEQLAAAAATADAAPAPAAATARSLWPFGRGSNSDRAIKTEGRAADDILRELEEQEEEAQREHSATPAATRTTTTIARRLALGLLREREALKAERALWISRLETEERRAEAALASKRLIAERLARVEANEASLAESALVGELVASKTQAAVQALELQTLRGELAAMRRAAGAAAGVRPAAAS
jgi:hypothetical protein